MTNVAVKTIWEATKENDFNAVEYLLQHGEVAVDERNSLGETPLHLAASRGFDGLVDIFLRLGANPNAKDKESGYTPLHRSFLHGHLNASLLLLNGGAILSVEDSSLCGIDHDGLSPLDLLSSRLQAEKKNSWGGEVYTFGKVDFQLGYHLPHGDEQYIPRRVKFQPGVDLVDISAAMYHTLAVSSTGQCYSWGFGKGGRLGTGSEYNCIHPVLLHFHQRIIVKASAGENHSLALTDTGQVFSWGSNSFGQLGFSVKQTCATSRLSPKRIDAFRGMTVVDIAAASCHSAAITSSGHVYTWGSNKKGQLGRKEGFGTDQAMHSPKRVDSLLPQHANPAVPSGYTSIVAAKVAVSCFHTCVILQVQKDTYEQGQVWQWGWGAYFPSQVNLRHSTREEMLRQQHANMWIPRSQQFPISIVDISCAPQHSIGLSSLGNVYTWGHGPNPSTGLNYVHLHDRATSVAAAKEHCAVVLNSGDVYTWGCGTLGTMILRIENQVSPLGHEGRNWQPIPKRVSKIKQAGVVVAGPQHTAVLVQPTHPLIECGNDTLIEKCQQILSQQVNLQSVVKMFAQADMLDMIPLQGMCRQFVAKNLDAVLEMSKDAEDWPIELDEDGQQRQLALQELEVVTKSKLVLESAPPIPIKKEIEKKLRSLRKRVDQIIELELLVSLSDAQRQKIKRKSVLLQQIHELEAQLPKSATAVTKTSERKKELVIEPPSEQKRKPSKESKHKESKQSSTCERSKRTPSLLLSKQEELKKADEVVKPPSQIKPKTSKSKPKFVPLETFLSNSSTSSIKPIATPPLVPNTPPMSWASPSFQSHMTSMKLNHASPSSKPLASSNVNSFSLESFIKPSRKGKQVIEEKKAKTWQVTGSSAAHSLKSIQEAEVIHVKQSWNLRENKWGLCSSENVNLADIQSIELEERRQMDELVRQDMEFAKRLQEEEYEQAKRQSRRTRRPKVNRAVRTA